MPFFIKRIQNPSLNGLPCEVSQSRYTDGLYLCSVVAYLKRARVRQGLEIHHVARKAGVSRSVIARAEQRERTPCVQQFKAWAEALGFSWSGVWSDSLPKVDASGILDIP
jgi:hypothetical protein